MTSWPGSETPIFGKYPTYYLPYDDTSTSSDKFKKCLEWLDMDSNSRPSFIAAYLGIIDSVAHSYGTEHPKVPEAGYYFNCPIIFWVDD